MFLHSVYAKVGLSCSIVLWREVERQVEDVATHSAVGALIPFKYTSGGWWLFF